MEFKGYEEFKAWINNQEWTREEIETYFDEQFAKGNTRNMGLATILIHENK